MSDEQRAAMRRDIRELIASYGVAAYEASHAAAMAVETVETESARWHALTLTTEDCN